MGFLSVSMALLSLGLHTSHAQQSSEAAVGRLCVLPHPKLEDIRTGSPEMPPPAKKYAIRLNDGHWIDLSTRDRRLFTDLPRTGRNRVAIRGDGRPWASFTFTFDEFSDLCLYQSDFYLTWQIHLTKQSFRSCRCEGVKPAEWKKE